MPIFKTDLTVIHLGLHDSSHQLFLHRRRDAETSTHAHTFTAAIWTDHLYSSIQNDGPRVQLNKTQTHLPVII